MKFNLIKKLDKKKTKTYFFRIFLLFVIFLIYYFPVKSNNNLFLEDNFFPEGITISKNGNIYVGSLKENKIVKFKNKKKILNFLFHPILTD